MATVSAQIYKIVFSKKYCLVLLALTMVWASHFVAQNAIPAQIQAVAGWLALSMAIVAGILWIVFMIMLLTFVIKLNSV